MTVERIAKRLESMKFPGFTGAVDEVVVTRWGPDAFEVSTFKRRPPVTLEQAACEVAAALDGSVRS